jgi:hypothetical protein
VNPPIDGNWLFAAAIFALALLFVVAMAAIESRTRAEIGRDPDLPVRPTLDGTLPLFPGCLECRLAHEAGPTVHARHLARDHGYLVFDAGRAA